MIDPADEPLALRKEAHAAAHRALDCWIADCERDANEQFKTGRAGQVGMMTFNAEFGDAGVSITIARTVVTIVE